MSSRSLAWASFERASNDVRTGFCLVLLDSTNAIGVDLRPEIKQELQELRAKLAYINCRGLVLDIRCYLKRGRRKVGSTRHE
jgi:hypothetical protein